MISDGNYVKERNVPIIAALPFARSRHKFSDGIPSLIRSPLPVTTTHHMSCVLLTGVSAQNGAYLTPLLLEHGHTGYGTQRRTGVVSFWRLQELGLGRHDAAGSALHDDGRRGFAAQRPWSFRTELVVRPGSPINRNFPLKPQ